MARRRWLPTRIRRQWPAPPEPTPLPQLRAQPRRLRALPARRSKATPHPAAGSHLPVAPVGRRSRPAGLLRRPRPVTLPWPQAITTTPLLPQRPVQARRTVPPAVRRRASLQPPLSIQLPATTQALPPQPARHRTVLLAVKRRLPTSVPQQMLPGPVDDVLRPRVKVPAPGRRARLAQPPVVVTVLAAPAYPIQTARPHRLPLAARRRQPAQPPWQPQAAAPPALVFKPERTRRSVLAAARRRTLAAPPLSAKSHVDLVQRARPKPALPRHRAGTSTVVPVVQATVPWSQSRSRPKPLLVKRPKLNHPAWSLPPVPNPPLVFCPSQRARPRGLLRRRSIAQVPWAEILGRIGLPPISATGGSTGLGISEADTSTTSVTTGTATAVTTTTGAVAVTTTAQ